MPEPITHNPILFVKANQREAANSEVQNALQEYSTYFPLWRWVSPDGTQAGEEYYSAPGMTEGQYQSLVTIWALSFPTGGLYDATAETALSVFEGALTTRGLIRPIDE